MLGPRTRSSFRDRKDAELPGMRTNRFTRPRMPMSPLSAILHMQRTVGNQVTQRVVMERMLQTKRQKSDNDPFVEQYAAVFPHVKEPKVEFAKSESNYDKSLSTGRNIEMLLKGEPNTKALTWNEEYVTDNYETTTEPQGMKLELKTMPSKENELMKQSKTPGKYLNYYYPEKRVLNAYDNWHYDEKKINFNKLLVFQYRQAIAKLNDLERSKTEEDVGATAEQLRQQIRQLEEELQKLDSPQTDTPSDEQSTETQDTQQPLRLDPKTRRKEIRKEKTKAVKNLEKLDNVGKRQVKGGIDVLVRDPVVNPETLDTMFWTNQWSTALKENKEVTVTEQDGDDFWALLGTPNGRAGGFMAVESGDELGITGIEKITYKNRHLSVHFKKQ